jgi:hypothetical protein
MADDSRKGSDLAARGNRVAPEPAAASRDIDAFLQVAKAKVPGPAGARGRLVFALDATMSRQPTWDMACRLQSDMFATTAASGGLDVQLVYFRGFNECRASRFVPDARALTDLMAQIDCRGGHTQIGRVLEHVRGETRRLPVQALVYVGDALEEALDPLCATAGEIGLLGVKAFMFHEGGDPVAERGFREIARLTGGAYARFDAAAGAQLSALLRAAAAYAAGGRAALNRLADAGDGGARLLVGQMQQGAR